MVTCALNRVTSDISLKNPNRMKNRRSFFLTLKRSLSTTNAISTSAIVVTKSLTAVMSNGAKPFSWRKRTGTPRKPKDAALNATINAAFLFVSTM